MRYALMLLCLALAACSSPPKATPQTEQAGAEVKTEALMQRLLTIMETPGNRADQLMREGAVDFFARPDAVSVLSNAYNATTELWPRWKLIRLAGKSQRADAVTFLFGEALKPVQPERKADEGNAFSASNEEYVNRFEAAMGVVNSMPTQGSRQVEQIIASVDISIARILGSALFSLGHLNDTLIAGLQARGVPTDYRRMSVAEERALMTVTPSHWRQP